MLKEKLFKSLLVIVTALLCVNIIISCSGDVSKTPSSSATPSTSISVTGMKPSEVVTAAYMAANEEKYAEAEKYLSSETKTAIQEAKELAGGIKDVWDKKTRNRTIETIEIIRGDVKEDKATIAIRIHFKDKSIYDQHEQLIKEGGQWKMTL